MQVTTTLIDHLAKLSRLQFNPEEKEKIHADLQRMIDFTEKLQEIDTTGVEPLTHMTGNKDVFRNDHAEHSISAEEGLQNAAKKQDRFFVVPKVIKK